MNNDRRLCKACGENWTSSPDGLCWKCWEKENEGKQRDPEALQKAIKRTQLTLTILKYRAEGLSYANIAHIVVRCRPVTRWWSGRLGKGRSKHRD